MNSTPTWDDLNPGDTVALHSAADRLAAEFDGSIGTDTIDLFLRTSFDQFAAHATVTQFLPLMAERFTRQHLKALAKVEGRHDDGLPTVLFLDVRNADRSPVALGWFTQLAGDRAVAWSGGSEPATEVDPAAIAVMAERGIDISAEFPKPWTDEIVGAADIVVSLGGPGSIIPGQRFQEWDIPDPALPGVAIQAVRDAIEVRVRALLADLGLPETEPSTP